MVQYTPASDKLVHEVSVDFKKRMVSDRVHVVQYDNSMPIVAVSLYSDSATYIMPQNYEANIRVKKPDGKFVYNKALGCDNTKAILYFEITEQMTSKNGLLTPIIELRNGNNVAASGYFEIEVDRNPVQQGDIESTNEYTRIEEYVKEAGKYADNAKASADSAANSASSASSSASAAKTSETNAKTSETKAKTSETNAGASALDAAQSATDALTSATNAANSANEALSSEAKATQSAIDAAASALLAAEIAQKQLDVSDLTQVVNQLTHHRISQKITDSDGNYIHDDNGGYLEFEALFVEPADIVPIIEKLSDLETKLAPALTTLANLEKRLANLENTAIQGVIL